MSRLVAGAGGFIGGHLCRHLEQTGYVRAVDLKSLYGIGEWHQLRNRTTTVQWGDTDLRWSPSAVHVVQGMNSVFNLACNMGGIGFIEKNKAACMESVLINTNLLRAARDLGVKRFFFASSACVYAANKQADAKYPGIQEAQGMEWMDTRITRSRMQAARGLKESDAYPADPEDGYGWEKLFSERMCRHFFEDYGLETRVARLHNVYGPYGTYEGGREKAPAAICRKVIQAKLSGKHEIEIWGDGEQSRSFLYIDDCIEGILKITDSDIREPINLGSSELVTINQLVSMVEDIAQVKLKRIYDLDAPKGVRGRNSDNTMIKERLGWEPSIPLRTGLEKTYVWIYDRMSK